MIQYRDAAPDDAPLLSALSTRTFTETFGHLYKPEDLAAFLANYAVERWAGELADPDLTIRLAFAGEEPAGYAKIGPVSLPVEPPGPSAELRQLYVLKPWQGEGVARALMDWALAQAEGRGAQHLYLSVFIDNHRARRFYERHGFVEVGPYAFKVGNHVDEDIIMHLDLRKAKHIGEDA
ncbi:MAG TPA: GNAT family N-acetyltransferase [Allosphingosinicella sp.]